jgi:hypothetical protein
VTKYTTEWALDTGLFGWSGWAAKNAPEWLATVTAWSFDFLFGTTTMPTEQGLVTA